jgi:hypothetical protein
MIALSSLPMLALVPFGGGVASRYLMFCMPCMFVLAAKHWDEIDARLPTFGYRLAIAVGLFAFNLPYLASICSDGGHFDVRAAAKTIEAMDLKNPVIVATGPKLLNHYLERNLAELDLTNFEGGIPKTVIQQGIDLAVAQQRPLLLVSREDRSQLTPEDQDWLYSRFALVQTHMKSRFDHRRFRMSVYQYRPELTQRRETSCGQVTVQASVRPEDEPAQSDVP